MFLRTNDTIFYETSRRDSKQLFRIETISLWILFSNSFSNNNNMYIIALKCTHSFPLKDTREHIIYSIYCRQVNNVNINIVTTTSAYGIYIKCYNNIKTIWYHTIYIYIFIIQSVIDWKVYYDSAAVWRGEWWRLSGVGWKTGAPTTTVPDHHHLCLINVISLLLLLLLLSSSSSSSSLLQYVFVRVSGISMHKGFAFVQFTNPFDARSACVGEDARTVLGQTLGNYCDILKYHLL